MYNTGAARDALISRMVDDFSELKMLKRACKTKVLFRLKGDEEGSWRTIRGGWGDLISKWIEAKYGDRVEAIANRDRI